MGVDSLARTLANVINENRNLRQIQSQKMITTGIYKGGTVQVAGVNYPLTLAVDLDLKEGSVVRVVFDPTGKAVVIGQ